MSHQTNLKVALLTAVFLGNLAFPNAYADAAVASTYGCQHDHDLVRVDRRNLESSLSLNVPLSSLFSEISFRCVDSSLTDMSQCSASYISDSCHVLTALHCIAPCLPEPSENSGLGGMNDIIHYDDWKGSGMSRVSTINRSAQKMFQMSVRLDGELFKSVRIVASGGGRFNSKIVDPIGDGERILFGPKYDAATEVLALERLRKEMNLGAQGDWVVLEVPGAKCSKCAPLSDSIPVANTRVFALHHPGETLRDGETNSDGIAQYYSYGEILEKSEQERRLRMSYANEAFLRIYGGAEPEVIGSTVNSAPASSGSPLFDQNGHIIGVNVQSNTGKYGKYSLQTHLTTSVSSAEIRAKLYNQLSDVEFSQVTRCSNFP